MTQWVAINKATHAHKGWRRYGNYRFARTTLTAALVASECPKAASTLPIAFRKETAGYSPIALLGLEQDRCLLVDEHGKWLASYVPAVLRSHPFTTANDAAGKPVLCIDEGSGLLADAGEEGVEPFFDAQGNVSKAVNEILHFHQQLHAAAQQTAALCGLLEKHGLLEPWALEVQCQSGVRRVEGLYRVSEVKLNQLEDAAFLDLRRSGALVLVYAHLLSLQLVPMLAKLADARSAREQQKAAEPEELDLEFLNQNGTISFGPH